VPAPVVTDVACRATSSADGAGCGREAARGGGREVTCGCAHEVTCGCAHEVTCGCAHEVTCGCAREAANGNACEASGGSAKGSACNLDDETAGSTDPEPANGDAAFDSARYGDAARHRDREAAFGCDHSCGGTRRRPTVGGGSDGSAISGAHGGWRAIPRPDAADLAAARVADSAFVTAAEVPHDGGRCAAGRRGVGPAVRDGDSGTRTAVASQTSGSAADELWAAFRALS
jgi:hypothetical protein